VNIDNYISSGAIESYVLGLATAQEAAEVQQLSLQYPEIKQAIADFEASLEAAAFANAITPAASSKEKLMFALQDEFVAPSITNIEPSAIVVAMDENVTTPEQKMAVVRKMNPLRFVAAASIILLIVSGGLNIYFYSKYDDFYL